MSDTPMLWKSIGGKLAKESATPADAVEVFGIGMLTGVRGRR